jgi:small subunit ribosomal protein S17
MTGELTRISKRLQGVVKSDRMDKTVTVTVQRLVRHPLYGKYLRRRSTFMAHDPGNTARHGDLVEIESTRPLSRHKHWRVVRVLRRVPQYGEPAAGDDSVAEALGRPARPGDLA